MTLGVDITEMYGCRCNSYTMVCPHVHIDNPQALASELSPLPADNHGITRCVIENCFSYF